MKTIRLVIHDSATGEDSKRDITVAEITATEIIKYFRTLEDTTPGAPPAPTIECSWFEQSGSVYAFALHCDDPLFGYHFITGVIYTEFI
jgi:hypothetical protein